MPAIGSDYGSRQVRPRRRKPKTAPQPKRRQYTLPSTPPDTQDRSRAARQQQLARSVPVTPDQADRKRSPRQQRRDARVVARNVRESRVKVLRRGKPTVYVIEGRRTTTPPRTGGPVRYLPSVQARVDASRQQSAARLAPALTILEQLSRPSHAVAAGTRAAIHGKNALEGAKRGFQLKDKTLFSDVLHDLGVHGPVASIGGFALDVATDPTTYVSFGLASVARKAAEKEAAKATKKALKAGLTHDQAKRYGRRAYEQTVRKRSQARGLTVKAAGRELPGVRRATAKAGEKVQAGVGKVKPVRAGRDAARHLAADFNPNIVPDNISRAEYASVREATRTARSTASREIYKVRQRASAVNKAIGKDKYQLVLDAIERGAIKSLPGDLQKPARFLRDQFKYARRVEKRAGIRGATRKNYVPHLRADLAEEGQGIGQQSVGARTIRPSSSRARKDQRTLAEIRQAEPGKYIEDPGVLYAARLSESALSRSKAELNRRLAGLGRRVTRSEPLDLKTGEAVYHIKGSDIRKLDPRKQEDKAELARFLNGSSSRGGQYVALNEQAVDRALKRITPSGERSTAGQIVDRVQGVWKFAATQPNPGFHLRNFAGDTYNAYLAEHPARLARNIAHSGRALKELGRQEKTLRTLDNILSPSGRGVKIGDRRVPYSELIAEAEKVGGVRSGFVSRELGDLMAGKIKPSGSARIMRWANNREDLIRLATYIGGRQRGLTPEQAAARVARYHFDYSDLTELERRVLRRIMPFYTFSARDIPLQMKTVFTNPGKFAQYEKVREELAKAFNYKDDWDLDLNEREQRAVPLPIRIKGKLVTISLGPSGLPLTDLNEFPTTKNPVKQADEWIDRAMSLVTPGIKTPIELWSNMSFFFRDQIEHDEGPLVPAPKWVAKIPAKYRKQLGIVPDYVDKRSGKKQWGWPAKIGYAVGVLPGPASFLNRVLTPSERQDWKTKTLGYAGVRALPVDPVSTRIDRLYEERAAVDKKMRAWNQRGVNAENSNAEYDRLRTSEKDLTSHIMALRQQRGDKIIPGASKPKTSFLSPDAQRAVEQLQKSVGESGGFSPAAQRALENLRGR